MLSSLFLPPGFGVLAPSAAAGATSGLNVIVNERGRITPSFDAEGSVGPVGSLRVQKPAGAKVRRAILFAATTGFRGATMPGPVRLKGPSGIEQSILMGHGTPSGISSFNFWSDVTTVLKPDLDGAAAGVVNISVTEPSPESLVDGTLLAVIFDDPSQAADRSVSLLFGALLTNGDRFNLSLERPYDPADPASQMEMSLGISFSCQLANSCTRQYSEVDVNGRRVTSGAGGEDDGQSSNGALITVGGVGDSPANPVDPRALPVTPRSDDELYDLRPFLTAGDRSIRVDTRNPSADDNVFFAAFTGNPPVSQISTAGDKFVYVALGDSYQSGEGAGFNVRPAAAYLDDAYENGSNFPPQTGAQDNTYTNRVTPPGDSCHRALLNYAKINRDKFKPGAQVVLVDRTCSGATIEPGSKPAIVGPVGGGVDPASQVRQATRRLAEVGLSPSDVDLVTVGMGGNDAKFGEILAACLLPAVARQILDKYPDSPGEIKFVANEFLTCDRVDNGLFGFGGFHTDEAINALKPKELWAQEKLLATFTGARMLQIDYPNILPTKDSPAFCGGIGKGDVEYARKKVKKIDEAIRSAVDTTAAGEPRLELVEVEKAFGNNALCPSKSADQLANGVQKGNLDAELTRLLNLDGNGDKTARTKVDRLVTAYRAYRACLGNKSNPFDGSDCDLDQAFDSLRARAIETMDYLGTQQDTIMANVVSRPGSSDDTIPVAFDRSRGMFHPNDRGFAVLACHVLATYQDSSPDDCAGAQAPPLSTINGQFVGSTPVRVDPGDLLELVISGFEAFSSVVLTLFSTPQSLGEITTDANGVARANVKLPQATGGVHLLNLEGRTQDGTAVTKELPLQVSGRPVGGYATYLCCFLPELDRIDPGAPVERVQVTLDGRYLTTLLPDEDGGVLVFVPTVDRLRDPAGFVLEARSTLTGQVVRELIDPIPTAASLWATSTDQRAISITGSRFSAVGRVHSEGGILVTGSGPTLSGGVEYATALQASGAGASIQPPARQVTSGQGHPNVAALADYRPGGSISSTGPYLSVNPALCRDGIWTPGPADVLTGVVYVPCGVALGGSRRAFAATIAAEGPVTVSGSGVSVGRDVGPSIISGATGPEAIAISGAGTTLRGAAFAESGGITISGSRAVLSCGVLARTISVSGSGATAPVDRRCQE